MASSPPPLLHNGAQLGTLSVVVTKANGSCFEHHPMALTMIIKEGGETRTTSAKKVSSYSTKGKNVVFDETFILPLYHHQSTLVLSLSRAIEKEKGHSRKQQSKGHSHQHQHQHQQKEREAAETKATASIALGSLPQNQRVTKWFQLLSSNGENEAVVQMHLTHQLIYSAVQDARQLATSSLSCVPSHEARERVRKAIVNMAESVKNTYRFIDYFACIGVKSPKMAVHSINVPAVLTRFPAEAREDVMLPRELSTFCFPGDFELSAIKKDPECFSFRLNADMDQLLVTCLMFWQQEMIDTSSEERAPDELVEKSEHSMHDEYLLPSITQPLYSQSNAVRPVTPSTVAMFAPRVLVLTSRLNFVSQHREILSQLYQHFFDRPAHLPTHRVPCLYEQTPSSHVDDITRCFPCNISCQCIAETIPLDCKGRTLEEWLVHLLHEIELPIPGSVPVEFDVCCRRYCISLPALEHDLPSLSFSLPQLFQVLDVDVVLQCLRCMLTEMRLVFFSSSRSLLHSVTECLLALIFPFCWSHIYIPLLPKSLWNILDAPVCFICGIHSESTPNLDHITDLSAFAVVDIDRSIIDITIPPPSFANHNVRVLMKGLRKLIRPDVFDADQLCSFYSHKQRIVSSDAEALHFSCFAGVHSDFAYETPSDSIQGPSLSMTGDHLHSSHVNSSLSEEASFLPKSNGHSVSNKALPIIPASIVLDDINRDIRFEFFHFLSSLLTGYREHLYFVHGSTPTFDVAAFLSSGNKSESLPFLSRLCATQLFRDLLDRHVESPSFLQDFLTYLTPSSGFSRQVPFHIPPPPLRDFSEWSSLIHQHNTGFTHSTYNSEQRHLQSYSNSELDKSMPFPNDIIAVPDSSDETSLHFSLSSSLTADVSEREGSTVSTNTRRNTLPSIGEDGALLATDPRPPEKNPRRLAVLSLAPAVSTFLSSQTFVTTSGEMLDYQKPQLPHALSVSISLEAANFIKLWLLPQPRAFTLMTDAQKIFFKNPSTLLHKPIAPDDEIFIPEKELHPTSLLFGADLTHNQHVLDGNDTSLRISIQSPNKRRNSFARLHRSFSPQSLGVGVETSYSVSQSSSDWSPQPYQNSPAASPLPTPSPYGSDHGHQRSSSLSRHRTPQLDDITPVSRQQITALLSKSDLELKRPKKKQRMHILLSCIMKSSQDSTQMGIDVGELSAVQELLAIKEWREQLIETLGTTYHLYVESSHINHRFLPADSFTALQLLFNVALEECAADGDFVSATVLIWFAQRIYSIPTNDSNTTTPPVGRMPIAVQSFTDRVYLIQKLKRLKLFQEPALWTSGYLSKVHLERHGVWPRQACPGCAREAEAREALENRQDDEDDAEWQRVMADKEMAEAAALREVCLESMVQIINTMASLGCKEMLLKAFIDEQTQEDDCTVERRDMLFQLAHNAVAAQSSLIHTLPSSRVDSFFATSGPNHRIFNQDISESVMAKYQPAMREPTLQDL